MKPNPLTKALKDICKKTRRSFSSRLYLHADQDLSAPEYQRDRALFTLSLTDDSTPVSRRRVERLEGIPGWIKAGYTSETEPDGQYVRYSEGYAPTAGYWSLYGCDTFANVIELLPSDAEIELRVLLDHGTSPISTAQGLHVDHLVLVAKWTRGSKEYRREYRIDDEVSRHNTARFGSPNHERDAKGRAQ